MKLTSVAAPAPVSSCERSLAPFPGLLATVGLLAALFGPTFLRLSRIWDSDASYSHGYLILPISLGLAWRYLRENACPENGQVVLGVLTILAGCMVHLAAVVSHWLPLDFVALVLVLRGLAVLAGGRAWAVGLTFPILFLFFMFPLPVTWTAYASLWLQEWVARLSTGFLDLFLVCYRRGTAIFLAGVPEPLVVAEECSGLRQIVAFVAMGALLGHLSRSPRAPRALLILAAIPVAIIANVARVLLMATGASFFGTSWLQGWLHHAPALFSLPLGLALFALVAWSLGRLWPSFREGGRP